MKNSRHYGKKGREGQIEGMGGGKDKNICVKVGK